MTAYCVEEAAMLAYELHLAAEDAEEEAARQPERKPGQITDPVMADAMAKAKELHFRNTGVRT